MPELPEVETVRRGLEREALYHRITGVEVANDKVLKGQTEAVFRARVTGRHIKSIVRRGKYLLITLDQTTATAPPPTPPYVADNTAPLSPTIICLHLKMRGQIRVAPVERPVGSYHCVSLLLSNGSAVRFHDMWTWGEIRAMTPDELKAVVGLARMGPEPLGEEWSATLLASRVAAKRTAIKAALLDQSVLAGVGNIYADEALFRARVHPQRLASSLNTTEVERLAGAIRATLTEAVAAGGTTSEEFLDVDGKMGGFQPQVYDRGGGECMACGTTLTRIRLGGRGTVYCSSCQPLS